MDDHRPGSVWAYTGMLDILQSDQGIYTHQYTRNEELVYDLFYAVGDIQDAGAYVTGQKKFSIEIPSSTTANACTQILLQFEKLERTGLPVPRGPAMYTYNISSIGPYPQNRHSRYLANVPEGGGRVEFEFLDRPDESVSDMDVNAAVLLFAPGEKNGNTYLFQNLDSYTKCNIGEEGCLASPVKPCPALYMSVEGAATGRLRTLQQQEPDCSDCANPSCVGVGDCSVDIGISSLQQADPGLTTEIEDKPESDIMLTGDNGTETAVPVAQESISSTTSEKEPAVEETNDAVSTSGGMQTRNEVILQAMFILVGAIFLI